MNKTIEKIIAVEKDLLTEGLDIETLTNALNYLTYIKVALHTTKETEKND